MLQVTVTVLALLASSRVGRAATHPDDGMSPDHPPLGLLFTCQLLAFTRVCDYQLAPNIWVLCAKPEVT